MIENNATLHPSSVEIAIVIEHTSSGNLFRPNGILKCRYSGAEELFMHIIQLYQDIQTGVCNRIEADNSVVRGFDRHAYLEYARQTGVSNPAERSYYQLHALFVKMPSNFWLELMPIWDIHHGWHPTADSCFS